MKFKKFAQEGAYEYSKRHDELKRIKDISYRGLKLRALERFVRDEKKILFPAARSQALDSAQQSIAAIKRDIDHEQHGVPDSIQALRRSLFGGDARREPLAVPLRLNFFRPLLPVLPAAVRQLNLGDDEVISLSNPPG